jgi:hypothetical protein
VLLLVATAGAQSAGNSGSINGAIVDSNGAVVRKARVELRNPVSGFGRLITTDSSGRFEFTNIPFNPYHLIVMAAGFAIYAQDVEPRSSVPVSIAMKLQVASSTTEVTVEPLGETWWKTIPRSTPAWTRICSTSCRWNSANE